MSNQHAVRETDGRLGSLDAALQPGPIRRWLSGILFLVLRLAGYIPSNHLRLLAYRMVGMRIGRGSHIYMGAEIRSPHLIRIGTGSSIGHRAILDGRGSLAIGSNVNLSTGVWVWTMDHDPRSPTFDSRKAAVVIGDFVWLSCRVVVLPGVTIGEGAVAAAGAVVTRDVSPYTIVGGVPAIPIGERPRGLRYELSEYTPLI